MSFIDWTNFGMDFFESDFSIAVSTTRQSEAWSSFVCFGAMSSMFFSAFFNALNFM